jgi:hypothetical protein
MSATLRDYARQYARAMTEIGQERAALPYKLLLEYGEESTWSPLPQGEEYGFAKQCFGNAGGRALFDESLTYYEGITDSLFVTMPHAWVQDAEGRVIELTLRHNDDRCAFCNGEGQLAPTDHYDYYGHDEDDPEWDDADIDCEMCDATGKGKPESREGMSYLGIPIPTEVLRATVLENETWGVLFEDPERVERMLRKEAA